MSNDNSDLDIFADFDNTYQQEEAKYTYSQNKTDQIKELGLDGIDTSSDDDDDDEVARPSASQPKQHQQVTRLKRTLSDDDSGDNDYDGDFKTAGAEETRFKKIKQFTDELNQENDQKYMNENSNYNHNMSLNDNNTNNLSSNDGDAGSNNAVTSSKESKEANARAKERLNYEKEKAWRKRRLEQQQEENKKMQVLMANFNDEQLNRYEMFRRSAFQKASVKKIIQTVCGKAVSHDVIIAMSGMAKVFVGEMMELALDVQQKWSETGPLHPKHIREASRIYKKTNKVQTSNKHKKSSLFI